MDGFNQSLPSKLPSGVQILKSIEIRAQHVDFAILLITAGGETSTSYYGQEPSAPRMPARSRSPTSLALTGLSCVLIR